MRYAIFFFITITFSYCGKNNSSISNIEANKWFTYIKYNTEIQREYKKAYSYDTSQKVFKVVVSRRNNFLRITMYPFKTISTIKDDLPCSLGKINNDTFLFYDGSELINQTINETTLENILKPYNLSKEDILYNPKVLQFDIDLTKKIVFNYPAQSPYDIVIDSFKHFPRIK